MAKIFSPAGEALFAFQQRKTDGHLLIAPPIFSNTLRGNAGVKLVLTGANHRRNVSDIPRQRMISDKFFLPTWEPAPKVIMEYPDKTAQAQPRPSR